MPYQTRQDLIDTLKGIHKVILTDPNRSAQDTMLQLCKIVAMCEDSGPECKTFRKKLSKELIEQTGYMLGDLTCISCGYEWSGLFPRDLEWAPCPQCNENVPTPLEDVSELE